jgi:hypothetical protein
MSASVEIKIFNGSGLLGLLTVALILLKLTGDISISWWWVFAPVLIPAAVTLLIIIFFIVVLGLLFIAGVILDLI